jgi:outer membrane receptor protein involved in Fe transport
MTLRPLPRLVLSLLVGVPALATAQEKPQPAPQPGQAPLTIAERVEVVATRLPEAPHDVPLSVEVLTGDDLRDLGAVTLRDALSLAAGVDVAPGGDAGPAGSVPEFWGLKEFDAFLLVVDDIPWGGAFNPSLTTLSLRDVERIEILRGPAPVTYGATSFVGVIHVVHKPAAAQRRYASGQFGSFGSGGGAVDLPIPLGDDWKSRLSVDAERAGFKDDRTSFGRLHALYRAAKDGPHRKTWFTADVNWLGQDPASPHPRQGPVLSPGVPLDANHNPAGAFLDETRVTAAFGTDRRLTERTRLALAASYTHSAQGQFRGFLTDVADVPDNATGYREDIDINDVYADAHLTWTTLAHLKLVAGGDLLFGNGEGRGATFVYTVPIDGSSATPVLEPTDLDLDTGSRRTFIGGYALAELAPIGRLSLSGGIRLNVTTESRGEGESVTHVRPSGGIGAMVALWDRGLDHAKLFVNYRNTFKPAAYDFSLAENEGVLEPETSQSIEGGVKLRFARGRLDVEASGFRMDFTNLVTATVVNGLPALINAGESRFQGFEVAAAARARRSLSARVTYSFHDARFVDFVQDFDGALTQLDGNRIEMSARHLFSAGVILAPEHGLVGSVLVKYVGDRYMNKRNTALAEPFTTVDAGVGYRFGPYEVRLDGRNLSDRRDPVSESELGDAQYYRLFARTFVASAGVRF